MAKKIFIVGSIVLLLFLFTVPSNRLCAFADEIESITEETVDCVFDENWVQAEANMQHVQTRLMRDKETFEMFLDHTELDELEASIRGCIQLARAQDDSQFLLELESIITRVRYLRSLESFSVHMLL